MIYLIFFKNLKVQHASCGIFAFMQCVDNLLSPKLVLGREDSGGVHKQFVPSETTGTVAQVADSG
jgi:hypothetical protein